MKKDIIIPKVEGISMAIVREFNSDFQVDDWNVYLINEKEVDIEMVLISSVGKYEGIRTSELKHKIERLPAKSYARVEYIEDSVLQLMNNEFLVTFFLDNTLFDKTFIFKRNTIKESTISSIEVLDGRRGVHIK
jgi:hypothetical protein